MGKPDKIEPCYRCGKEKTYTAKEWTRRNKQSKVRFFCSSSCCSMVTNEERWAFLYENLPVSREVGQRLNQLVGTLRKGSRLRGKIASISLEQICEIWIEQGGICALSGLPMSLESVDGLYQVSPDRINSSKGYIKENVQLVCLSMNRMKHTASNKDVKEFLTKLKKSL